MLRLLAVLILIAAVIYGWIWWGERQENEAREEYLRYAHVIAETQVAAEWYRLQPDSFYIARDSILAEYNLTLEEMRRFKDYYKGDERRWAHLWYYVDSLTDSLVKHYDSLYLYDTLMDSIITPGSTEVPE